jgi:hypothetical protein
MKTPLTTVCSRYYLLWRLLHWWSRSFRWFRWRPRRQHCQQRSLYQQQGHQQRQRYPYQDCLWRHWSRFWCYIQRQHPLRHQEVRYRHRAGLQKRQPYWRSHYGRPNHWSDHDKEHWNRHQLCHRYLHPLRQGLLLQLDLEW